VRSGGPALDWGSQPRPYKLYPGLEPISLSSPHHQVETPALAAIASVGPAWDQQVTPDIETVATILHYTAGVIRRLTLPKTGKKLDFRAASCTGALYHVDVYLVAGPLGGLDAGVYQFGPQDHALRLLRPGDWRAALAEACADRSWVAQAPLSMVLTTTFWRNAWRYGERAYRHAFWDGGTMAANALALASASGLPAGVVLGFVDRTVNRLLDLNAQKEAALAVLPLGRAEASPPPPPGQVQPLGLRTAVYSASEADLPAIRAMHAASTLARTEEVILWRERGKPSAPAALSAGAGRQTVALSARTGRGAGAEGVLTLGRCIQLRGSARRFRRAPISTEALGTVLWAATRGFSTDYRAAQDDALVECLLLVSAVGGLEPGLYRYRPGHSDVGRFTILTASREVAGRLVLDGQRGADAAVLVLLMSDLPMVLGRLGNRGYRAAQMEAGIMAGRLYLAATEGGLGVTGLTFYDDEVSRACGQHAPDLSPMLAVALGHPG
jgi:SagB-type dehydrogenase family enzyme